MIQYYFVKMSTPVSGDFANQGKCLLNLTINSILYASLA